MSDLALQADGKLLFTGQVGTPAAGEIWRLDADGKPDTGFGTKGAETVPLPGGAEPTNAVLLGVLVEPNTQFTLDGTAASLGGNMVLRLNADGTLDTSFGNGGGATDFNGEGGIDAIALQSDGKIVVNLVDERVVSPKLTRLLANGAIGTSLRKGNVIAGTGTGAFQPNDDYIISPISGGEFQLKRYTLADKQDNGFASPLVDFADKAQSGDQSVPIALIVQPNGRVLTGGDWQRQTQPIEFGLARVRANGALDAGFGRNGVVTTPLNSSATLASITLQTDAKILAAGIVEFDNGGITILTVARYLAK